MTEIVSKESSIVSSLLASKLTEIDALIADNAFTTRDDGTRGDLVSAVQLAIEEVINSLKDSSVSLQSNNIFYGSINSSDTFNAFWTAVGDDLTALYKEADRIGTLVSNNHNYIIADLQTLLLKLKTANSKLVTYELYATNTVPNKRTLVENFNDVSQLDLGSSSVVGQECSVDTIQGVITLATKSTIEDSSATQDDIESVTISAAGSNGESYNGTTLLKTINSSDCYLYQYEHTQTAFGSYRLVLDFTIKLDAIKIINYIRIVPNNYGSKTWPKILAIDLSTDGINMTSIRDLLLTDETNDTQFVLAPYNSNYAGEGRYSFLPVKTQYIHFQIEQTSPYFDSDRDLYRWAIGIKNIEIAGIEYEDSSSLVSKDYAIAQGISQVTMDASEFPRLDEDVIGGTISHEISIDSGMNWKVIAPTYVSSESTDPEVLYINSVDASGETTGFGHLNSTLEASAIRYRITMTKDESEISDTNLIPYYSPVVRKLTLNIATKEDI